MKRFLFLYITIFLSLILLSSCKGKKNEIDELTEFLEEESLNNEEYNHEEDGLLEEITLKLSVFSPNDYSLGGIDEIVSMYRSFNENVNIEIVSFVSDEKSLDINNEVNAEDIYSEYYKKVALDIKNGTGADIYYIQDFDTIIFNKSDYFLDLNELMQNETSFTEDNYYLDILKLYEEENKLYGLPMGFTFDTVSVNKNVYEKAQNNLKKGYANYDEIYNFSEDFENSLALNQTYNEYLIYEVSKKLDKYIDFENKEVNFNNEQFSFIKSQGEAFKENGILKNTFEESLEEFREIRNKSNFILNNINFLLYEPVINNEDSEILNEEDINDINNLLGINNFNNLGVLSFEDKY